MNHQTRAACFSPVVIHAFIGMLLMTSVYLLQYYFPVAYVYFAVEDSLAEYGTFIFFLMAGVLIAWNIKQSPAMRRPGYVLLCLGLIFIGMEEISWGQRLFGIQTPYIISQHNAQAELNIHNSSYFPSKTFLCYAILIWAVLWPEMAGRFSFVKRFSDKIGIPLVAREFYPYFILGFIVKLFDVIIAHGEIGELFLGIAFFLVANDMFCRFTPQANLHPILRWHGTRLLVAVTATVLLTILGPQDTYALKRRLHASAITEYPKRGLYRQAQKIFQYIAAHEELKNDRTLLDYGLFLRSIHDPDAQNIFMNALQEARSRGQTTPDKPDQNRLAGVILKLLDQHDEAQKEFQEALKKDQARLLSAGLDWERVRAHQSMGETYLAMGKHELAAEYLQKALDYAEDGLAKAKIRNLLKTIDLQ